jgi:hypothetical protein
MVPPTLKPVSWIDSTAVAPVLLRFVRSIGEVQRKKCHEILEKHYRWSTVPVLPIDWNKDGRASRASAPELRFLVPTLSAR